MVLLLDRNRARKSQRLIAITIVILLLPQDRRSRVEGLNCVC